jgi:hypothetical protein
MRQVLLTMLLLLVSAGTGLAGDSLRSEISVAPWFGSHFGHTKFALDFEGGRSELVFPLDVKQAGLELGYRAMAGNRPVWTASFRIGFDLSTPGKKMTDRDWFDDGYAIQEFSSTESTAEGSIRSIAGEFTYTLLSGKRMDLAVVAGVEYQRIQQDLVGLEGWQWFFPDLPETITVITFNEPILAGTYEVRYFRPQIGLMPRFYFGPVTVIAKGVAQPLLHVRDIDDHVQRQFQIRTDGKGFGWGGGLAVEWNESTEQQRRFFGRLSGDVSKTSIDAKGARIYYVDFDYVGDPDDPDDDEFIAAGSRFLEEHKISSTQYALRLTVGLRF